MSSKEAVFSEIKTLMGPGGFIDDPSLMEPFLVAWRNSWKGKTPFIALPKTTGELSALLALCHKEKIPVVPQGGNTGLVGGAIPSATGDELLINLSRMNKIRQIDATGSVATVEAGVVLKTLQDAAETKGLLFPLSMASEGSAQIGGLIATNAGGTAVLRYGNMRALVLGLEVVLSDGRILSGLKKLYKDNTGYNLTHYFIGSEGTLGIITAATLRLFPPMQQTVTSILACRSASNVMELFHAVRGVFAEHIDAFEMISLEALRLVIKHNSSMRFPGREDAPYYVLLGLGRASLTPSLREEAEGFLSDLMERGMIADAAIAESRAQEKQFWALRENASSALRQEGPALRFDVSLPLTEIVAFVETTTALVKAQTPEALIAPFGHIGDGNIHYNMCFPGMSEEAFTAIKVQLQDLVYEQTDRFDGSISAEHGIGVERKKELIRFKQPEALSLMRRIKDSFDPLGLMNPRKIFD